MDNQVATFQMTLAPLSSGSSGPTRVGCLGLFTLSLKAVRYTPNDMLLHPRRIQSLLLFIACLRLQSRDKYVARFPLVCAPLKLQLFLH